MLTLSPLALLIEIGNDLLECLRYLGQNSPINTSEYVNYKETLTLKNLYFNVRLRTPKGKVNTIRNRLLHLRYILSGLSRRIFTVTKRLTILGESHYPSIQPKSQAGTGRLSLDRTTVFYSGMTTRL